MYDKNNDKIAYLLDTWSKTGQEKLVSLGVATLLLPPVQVRLNIKDTKVAATPPISNEKSKQEKADANQVQPQKRQRSLKPPKPKLEILDDSPGTLPKDLDVAAGTELFLATLAGKSRETARTYRTGCRRFWTFLYETGRGTPSQLPINALPPTILERYYEWLLGRYNDNGGSGTGGNSGTVGGYMAAARVLFEYLASRGIMPGNVQYQQLVARLKKMQGRSSGYRTPRTLRTKGNLPKIEQLAQMTIAQSQLANTSNISSNAEENQNDSGNQETVVSVSETSKSDVKTSNNTSASDNPDEVYSEVKQWRTQNRQIAAGRRKNHEAEEVRQHLEEARNRAIILTLYTTGMRRHEIAALNRADLEDILALCSKQPAEQLSTDDAESNESTENIYELIIRGKGNKERLAYFDRVTLAAIGSYLDLRGKDGYRPLFIQHHRGRDRVEPGNDGENYRVSIDMLGKAVTKFALEKLGVKIRPHDFRHNLATTLLNAGAKLEEVQDILGHSSPVTTKLIYAHYSKTHLRDVFARYRQK